MPQTTIDRFLGLNRDMSGATQLQVGEAEEMINFRVTDSYKLRKLPGYEQLFASLGNHPIRGMWYGKVGGSNHLLFACNGKMYRRDYLSDTDFASLDTSTYTLVDVVITTALDTSEAGTTGVDDILRLDREEIDQASIDNEDSVGKYYYHSDKTIYLVVEKGAFANISEARTAFGTITLYFPIGTLTDDLTTFFYKDGAVYILNGTEYYKWTGTGSITQVEGYRPTIAINAPPGGGGTLYEQINLLTGAKAQSFSTVDNEKEYVLAESDVDSVDFVILNGVELEFTTDYTLDAPITKVILVNNPGDGEGNLIVGWTKDNATNREIVTKHRYARMFGNNDERVFLFGNGNARIHSAIPLDGSSTAEYFEALSIDYIGSSDITDICQQYDRQIIFTEHGAYYSYQEDIFVEDEVITSFPIFSLNNKIGNVAVGQVQLIQNTPYSIDKGLYSWIATNVRDERNAMYLSKRVQPDLDKVDLSSAITYDYEKLGEYWLCVGKCIWVYNYKIDVWYKFILNDTPSCFLEIDGEMYFGTDKGQIMKFGEDLRSFNGEPINAEWYMGFYDADAEWLRKYLNYTHISLKPESWSKIDAYWETNKSSVRDIPVTIGYTNMDFDNIDFDDWSFLGNYNPQPFRIKTKAKKWVYFRLILKNNSDRYTAHVLSINLLPVYGSISK